jgi:hypothetical protein
MRPISGRFTSLVQRNEQRLEGGGEKLVIGAENCASLKVASIIRARGSSLRNDRIADCLI